MSTPSPSSDRKPDYLGAMSKIISRGRPKPGDHDCYACGRDFDRKTEFKDALSAAEYGISGLCQQCQGDAFANPDAEDESPTADELGLRPEGANEGDDPAYRMVDVTDSYWDGPGREDDGCDQ